MTHLHAASWPSDTGQAILDFCLKVCAPNSTVTQPTPNLSFFPLKFKWDMDREQRGREKHSLTHRQLPNNPT